MLRRTVAALTTAVAAAALVGCSTDPDQSSPGGATPSAPAASVGATPGVPPGRAPGEEFAVRTREATYERGDRKLPVTIWFPAEGRQVADGRFPLVLFSHGLGGQPDDYDLLLRRWASAGLVVAAPSYPFTSRGAERNNPLDVLNQPADASQVITSLLRDEDWRDHLERDRIAAAGHSAGGITTVGLFTSQRDERLDAGIVLSGNALGVGTSFTGPAAPLLFVHGELDDVVSYTSGRAAFEAAPEPKALLSLPKGRHVLRDGDEGYPVVADSTVEFLRWSLYGDARAKRRLTAEVPDGARLDNRL